MHNPLWSRACTANVRSNDTLIGNLLRATPAKLTIRRYKSCRPRKQQCHALHCTEHCQYADACMHVVVSANACRCSLLLRHSQMHAHMHKRTHSYVHIHALIHLYRSANGGLPTAFYWSSAAANLPMQQATNCHAIESCLLAATACNILVCKSFTADSRRSQSYAPNTFSNTFARAFPSLTRPTLRFAIDCVQH